MKHVIQRTLTALAVAEAALGANAYGQDALGSTSTRGNIDPTDAEASLIADFSLASEKRVILRTIGESLADQGVANPIADARFDVYKLDLADSSNNEIIGQNDNWKDSGQQLQIVASGLAPAADSDSAMIMTLEAGVDTLNAATISGGEGVALLEIFGLDAAGVGSTIATAAAGDNAEFTLLNTALAATGLDAALDEDGDFTLFAPTDAAFQAAFTPEELAELFADDDVLEADLAAVSDILLLHVVRATILSTDLDPGDNPVDALSEAEIVVNVGEDVTVENANVIDFDITAANGVVHIIDAVISLEE